MRLTFSHKIVKTNCDLVTKTCVFKLGKKKKNVEFPLTRPTLFYGPDPTGFSGKFVYTELKGQYKTVIPLSGDCKNAGH